MSLKHGSSSLTEKIATLKSALIRQRRRSADRHAMVYGVRIVLCRSGEGMATVLFASASFFLSPEKSGLSRGPFDVRHVSPEDAVERTQPRGLSWLDLAEGRQRLDRLRRNGGGETFFPWASPIPREARKSLRRHPPLRFGPNGCVVDRLRPVDRHRDCGGRGLENSKEK